MKDVHNENEEMKTSRGMEDVLGAPNEVPEVLRALISSGFDVPNLIDTSTWMMKRMDVLKDKYVLLLVSKLMPEGSGFIERGVDFAEGIVKNDMLEIVWLPIVSWNDETEAKVRKWSFGKRWYVVQHFSPIAGIKRIEEEWGLKDYPTLVMMNPRGDVLGNYVLKYMPRILPITPGEEMEKARRVKEHFNAPDEITAVLEALISGNGGVPKLYDCYTSEMVSIDVLKEKFVLLFISRLKISKGFPDVWPLCRQMLSSIYHGILKEDLVKLVCIPIVEEETGMLGQSFGMWRRGMPYYVVQHGSPVAGLNFIKKEWCLEDHPLLVLLNPQGNVLSKHQMLFVARLRGGVPPNAIAEYVLYWRSGKKKFQDFLKFAERAAGDQIMGKKNITLKYCLFIKTTGNRSVRKSFTANRGDWAALVGPDDRLICEGPLILNVLSAFDSWKHGLHEAPFEECFEYQLKQLACNVPTARR